MDGVNYLIEKEIANEEKLYVTGGSAGGIMTAWMIGKIIDLRRCGHKTSG